MDSPGGLKETDIEINRDHSAPPAPEPDNGNSPKQSTDSGLKEEEYIIPYDLDEHGFRRIIRNFTPSYVSPIL
jgi:hypothetical protein